MPFCQLGRADSLREICNGAHVLLDHEDYLPAYLLLTEAKRSDVKLADSFSLNPGSTVTMDRGYTD